MNAETPARKAQVKRKTRETRIELSLNVDGTGDSDISTEVGFLDHMLDLLARHAFFDIKVKAEGDVRVDDHHTVEDVGICLGRALKEALGEKRGIVRFGDASVPMEDALANVAVDIGGRSELVFHVKFPTEKVGKFDSSLTEEFLRAMVANAGINLHVNAPYGRNTHHITEAIFKGLARALGKATRIDPRRTDVPSTKGVI